MELPHSLFLLDQELSNGGSDPISLDEELVDTGMRKTLEKGLAGIITGASSGIGRALAVQLARQHGAHLILTARTESALEETKHLVEAAGGKAHLVVGEIASEQVGKQVVDECFSRYDRLDLLVNNAGLAKPGKLRDITPADWQYVFSVNFFAALNLIYLTLPHFRKNHQGKIVNISSVAGKIAFPGSVCYAASKFALNGMSEGMAAELAVDGIDVITVCPGWVRTEFFSKNQMNDNRNPTLIAQRKDLFGWLMKNVLSMSSEEVSNAIVRALNKGGSSELILTAPGVLAVRLTALFPSLAAELKKRTPLEYVDSSRLSNRASP
jgi:short-subunit dehydrogenase